MTSLRHIPDPGATDPKIEGYLAAARACILDVGWRRSTLTEVARRAGVSRMTIYRTWSDMPRLLADLMTHEWAGVVSAVVDHEPEDPAGEDGARRIARGLVATVRALRDNELFVRIVELDPELLLPYLLSRRGRSQEAILDVLSALVADGQADGSVRAGSPAAIARGLLLAAHGFALSAHTMVDDDVDEGLLDDELALLVERGLRP